MNPDTRYLLDFIKRMLVIALAILAGIVLNGLWRGQNMWGWIIAYWTVLTAKNYLDYILMR